MVNYQEGLIYKIAHKYSPYVYIGSTTNFNRRKAEHKYDCNNEKSKKYNNKVYQTIREMGGWDNFEMVLVVKCPCDDKKELHAKEFEYKQLFHANLNTQDAIKDPNYDKKYHEKNREKRNQYSRNYHKIISEENKKIVECECGCLVSKGALYIHRKRQLHLKLMSA